MYFYDLNIKEVFVRLGHATDQKRHLRLIRLRIFKMRWVSVANDHLRLCSNLVWGLGVIN